MVGVGAGLALIVLLVLQSFTGSGFFGTKTETVTSTVTSTERAFDSVNGSFAEHMTLVGSKNVSAIMSQYDRNAIVNWNGEAVGLAGTYIGAYNVSLLLNRFFETFVSGTGGGPFVIANVTRTIAVTAEGYATVNSTFSFSGQSTQWGPSSGTISAQDSYAYSAAAGIWLISRETWTFVSFALQYPAG